MSRHVSISPEEAGTVSLSESLSRLTHIARIVAMRKVRWLYLPPTPTSWFT
jgi:hypothetical protein